MPLGEGTPCSAAEFELRSSASRIPQRQHLQLAIREAFNDVEPKVEIIPHRVFGFRCDRIEELAIA